MSTQCLNEWTSKIRLLSRQYHDIEAVVAIAPRAHYTIIGRKCDAFLHPQEQDYAMKLSKKSFYSWVEGRIVAKRAIASFATIRERIEHLNEIVILPEILGECRGQPRIYLHGMLEASFYVSISHWPDAIAVVATTCPVGIDGEQVRLRPGFAGTVFTSLERVRLKHLNQQWQWSSEQGETLFWTIKEAYFKLQGWGLRGSLLKVEIQKIEQNQVVLVDYELERVFHLHAFFSGTSYWIASMLALS